jgi:hypothetical protein
VSPQGHQIVEAITAVLVVGTAVLMVDPERQFWDAHHWDRNSMIVIPAIWAGLFFAGRAAWRWWLRRISN